jgi:MFS family permease
LAQAIPLFALSLVGGVLADRFPRLQILLVTQSAAMVLALVLALLAALGKPPLWSLLLVAALAAIVISIDNPTRQAFLSDLVGKEILLNAVALNASVYNGAAVIGPSLAGLLLVKVGAPGCFLLNALSFLPVLVALLIIARHMPPRPVSLQRQERSLRFSFVGFHSLRSEQAILAVLAIAAATSLLGRPYLLLMPAFARTVQHVGAVGLGAMVAASGAGSLIGSLLLASQRFLKRIEYMLLVCGVGFGLALGIFALATSYVLAVAVLVLCGAGATMTMTLANTLLQTYARAEMRGRVMSLYTLIAAGLTPLGTLLISTAAVWLQLSGATVVMGVAVVVAVAVGCRFLRG